MKKYSKSKIVGLITIIMIFFLNGSSYAQSTIRKSNKEINEWYKKGEWLGNLKLSPHKSINRHELYRQYHNNSVWWDKAFEFLSTHDLNELKPGKYDLDTGNVVAFVSEGTPKELQEIKWETHKNFNDLQYIIKGRAKMGIVPIGSKNALETEPYNERQDVTHYDVSNAKYYLSTNKTFYIFSPEDIHQPAIKVPNENTIKRIIIKVRVPKDK